MDGWEEGNKTYNLQWYKTANNAKPHPEYTGPKHFQNNTDEMPWVENYLKVLEEIHNGKITSLGGIKVGPDHVDVTSGKFTSAKVPIWGKGWNGWRPQQNNEQAKANLKFRSWWYIMTYIFYNGFIKKTIPRYNEEMPDEEKKLIKNFNRILTKNHAAVIKKPSDSEERKCHISNQNIEDDELHIQTYDWENLQGANEARIAYIKYDLVKNLITDDLWANLSEPAIEAVYEKKKNELDAQYEDVKKKAERIKKEKEENKKDNEEYEEGRCNSQDNKRYCEEKSLCKWDNKTCIRNETELPMYIYSGPDFINNSELSETGGELPETGKNPVNLIGGRKRKSRRRRRKSGKKSHKSKKSRKTRRRKSKKSRKSRRKSKKSRKTRRRRRR